MGNTLHTYHAVLNTSPGGALFGQEKLFGIPHVADWDKIGTQRQKQEDKEAQRHQSLGKTETAMGCRKKVLVVKVGILHKVETKYHGPYVVTHIDTNGTVMIQCRSISERLNTRRTLPFFSEEG